MSSTSFINSTASQPPSVLLDSTDAVNASPSTGANGQNVDTVSTDFEAVFLTQMMQQMFAGDDLTNFFGGGTAGDVYKSYLLNEYGKLMAQAGGVGIAAQVKQELLKLQEVKS
jgi:Rod binding domain-containing protein